jgi:hypothetical protein
MYQKYLDGLQDLHEMFLKWRYHLKVLNIQYMNILTCCRIWVESVSHVIGRGWIGVYVASSAYIGCELIHLLRIYTNFDEQNINPK